MFRTSAIVLSLMAPCIVLLLLIAGRGHTDQESEPLRRLRGEEKPARGPELIHQYFADWHHPAPGKLDRKTQDAIWSAVKAVPAEAPTRADEGWVCQGPFGMFQIQGGRYSGRILDVDINADGIFRVAAASGGIWEREGILWHPLTEKLTTQWVGSLDTSPLDPDLILVATGEPWIRDGTGLWRSTDGGTTWDNRPMPGEPENCFRVRFQPDGQTVVGAFNQGVYRSSDAGLTWARTVMPHYPTDLALHPDNQDTMWVPVYEHGLFRSTDGGTTFSQVLAPGLPTGGNGRGSVAVCRNDPSRLYVAFATPESHMLGVFRSDDGGQSWTDVSPDDDYFWGQGWYNNAIGVSPLNPDLVFAGGGALMRSADGGQTWAPVASPHFHVDVHGMDWSLDGTQYWVVTDGGFSHSINDGLSFYSAFNRLPITQYVNIDVGDDWPMTMGGGSQDNAISVSTDNGNNWFVRWGGDGGGFTIDDNDSDRMWATSGLWGGSLLFRCGLSTNGGTAWADINEGIEASGNAYTRIRSDHQDPPTIFTNNGPWVYEAPGSGGAWTKTNPTAFPRSVREMTVMAAPGEPALIYACLESWLWGERLRVRDNGVWRERSFGLPQGFMLRKVAPHPTDPDRCFALMNGMGSPGQKVFRSENRGQSWTNISGNLPDVPLSDLVAHPVEDNTLYLATEFGSYHTTDGGQSWERWNHGMPEAAMVTEMTLVDLREERGELLVAAGTYGRGLWLRNIPVAVSAASEPEAVATRVLLRPAHPNPASDGTTWSFRLEEASRVSLQIYDLRGRLVDTLVDAVVPAGDHTAPWDARRFASGVYFARLQTGGDAVETRRVVLVK